MSAFSNTIKIPNNKTTFKLNGNAQFGGMLPMLHFDEESLAYVKNSNLFKKIFDIKAIAGETLTVNKVLEEIKTYARKNIIGNTPAIQAGMEDLQSGIHKAYDKYIVDTLSKKIDPNGDIKLSLDTKSEWTVLDAKSKAIVKEHSDTTFTLKEILESKGATQDGKQLLGIKGDCRYTAFAFQAIARTWQNEVMKELQAYIDRCKKARIYNPAVKRYKKKLEEISALKLNFANYQLLDKKNCEIMLNNEKGYSYEEHCMPVVSRLKNLKGDGRIFDPFYSHIDNTRIQQTDNKSNFSENTFAPVKEYVKNKKTNIMKECAYNNGVCV